MSSLGPFSPTESSSSHGARIRDGCKAQYSTDSGDRRYELTNETIEFNHDPSLCSTSTAVAFHKLQDWRTFQADRSSLEFTKQARFEKTLNDQWTASVFHSEAGFSRTSHGIRFDNAESATWSEMREREAGFGSCCRCRCRCDLGRSNRCAN